LLISEGVFNLKLVKIKEIMGDEEQTNIFGISHSIDGGALVSTIALICGTVCRKASDAASALDLRQIHHDYFLNNYYHVQQPEGNIEWFNPETHTAEQDWLGEWNFISLNDQIQQVDFETEIPSERFPSATVGESLQSRLDEAHAEAVAERVQRNGSVATEQFMEQYRQLTRQADTENLQAAIDEARDEIISTELRSMQTPSGLENWGRESLILDGRYYVGGSDAISTNNDSVVAAMQRSIDDPNIPAVNDAADFIINNNEMEEEIGMTKFSGEMKAEVIEMFGEERVDFTATNYREDNILTIHYPYLEVTNEIGEKHMIHDLYVRFQLHYNDSVLRFEGTRLTVSRAEAWVNYAHSHCSDNPGDWRAWCQGVTMTEIINGFINNQTHENFILILLTLDTFVESESIEGGPYCRSRDVYINGSKACSNGVDEDDLVDLPKGAIIYSVNDSDDGQDFVCKDVDEELVKKHLNIKYFQPWYSPRLKQSVSQRYVDNVMPDEDHFGDREWMSRNKFITFKGKTLYAELMDNPVIDDLVPGERRALSSNIVDTMKITVNHYLKSNMQRVPDRLFADVTEPEEPTLNEGTNVTRRRMHVGRTVVGNNVL